MHPNIQIISEAGASQCNDLERVTKGILQASRYRVVVVLSDDKPIGHIKLKGYKTFLAYGNSPLFKAGEVYEVQNSLGDYLDLNRLNNNFIGNKVVLDLEGKKMYLRKTRGIFPSIYHNKVPYHHSDIKTAYEDERDLIYDDDFYLDLSRYLSSLTMEGLECASIPNKAFGI